MLMTGPDSSQQNSPNASGGASEGFGGIHKRRWFWVLYAVVLIASVSFAAWQGIRFFRGGKKSSGPPIFNSLRRSYGQIGPPALPPTTGPGEMTDNPLAGVGMTQLDGDPGGIAPPKGAVRRSAFVRRTDDEVEMMARYAWQGSADQAAEYYKKYLAGKDMKFLGEQTRTDRSTTTRPDSSRNARPRRIFVFHGLKRHVTVTLRKMPRNDEMLSITLNLVCPDS